MDVARAASGCRHSPFGPNGIVPFRRVCAAGAAGVRGRPKRERIQETAQSGAPHWEGNAPKWESASQEWERLVQAHSPVIARLKRQLEAERAKTALAEQKAAELQDQLADLAQACAYP